MFEHSFRFRKYETGLNMYQHHNIGNLLSETNPDTHLLIYREMISFHFPFIRILLDDSLLSISC